jgi:hypothetical protein
MLLDIIFIYELEGADEAAVIAVDLEVGKGSIWPEAPGTMFIELPLEFKILEALPAGMTWLDLLVEPLLQLRMNYLSESRYRHWIKSDLMFKLKVFSLLFYFIVSFMRLHLTILVVHPIFDVEIRLLLVTMALREIHLDLFDLLEVFFNLVFWDLDVDEDSLTH